MLINDAAVHLLPLIDNNDFDNSSSESEDDDSIEVVSNVDEEENKIIDMTKYLTFSSDDESEMDDNDTEDRIDVVVDKASEQQQQHTQS
ncbi:unnamed protein product [Rotaria magnacalcarata]|nr:unnamed protein product [Rotaria magnacalcarata]CAF2089504.1 unnamed protein product [Rotaria magnacalcarata]CAF3820610.1 unnamed protein product [Rotaria magnacalcarata]CAF3830596.1 unnamed protein product [Rotaria magnacalcarata]CAF4372039.1 unnamed protein product [Rotaria magnacalcarata]